MFIFKLFVLFINVAFLVGYTEQKGYLITAPSTFQEETTEHICVSLHNTFVPVTVNIYFYFVDSQQTFFSTSQNATNNGVSCIEVYLPSLDLTVARFVAEVTSDSNPEISGNIESLVTLQRKQLVTVIVTDKPIYKPGQNVKFRVLSLSHSLKPQDNVWRVWVEDPSATRITQWNNLSTQLGLIELTFPLVDDSLQGIWKIYVQQEHSTPEIKDFKVLEYVVPKFEVVVNPPSRISADTNWITWEICSKYSYGRIVKGKVFVQVKPMKESNLIPPEINDSAQLGDDSGCFNYSLTSTELNLSNLEDVPDTIVFTATVEEEGTGISQNSTVSSRLSHTEFFLQFQCSNYFKPGLPYKGKVKLMTEDNAEVGAGKKIQICVKVLNKGYSAMNSQGCWSYTSDLGSQVVFTLPFLPKPQDVQMIMLIASAPDYPTKQYMNSSQILMIGPTASQTVRPWFSPSNSYLDAATRSPIICSSTHMIPVRYTVTNKNDPTPLFYYLVKSRGDLLLLHSIIPKAETLLQNNNIENEENLLVRSWRLPLRITPKMAPNSKLTIYYVRYDGEVIATTTDLVIEPCFPNKVRAHWSAIQTAPGSTVSMRVRAHPQSLCAVSVVDQSLYFNTPETFAVEKDLWSDLDAFNYPLTTTNSKNHCGIRGTANVEELDKSSYPRRKRFLLHQDKSYYADTISAFDELGVMVMSNLLLETRPCTNQKISRSQEERPMRCYKCSETDNSAYSTYLIKQNTVHSAKAVRHYFPETWIWHLVYTGTRGEVTIQTQTPHSITSWKSSVLCISDREGFGITSAPPLVTFVPFFIQLEVPYSLKQNEQVKIKLSIYNYMQYDLPVRLDVSSDDGVLILDQTTVDMCVGTKTLAVQVIKVKATKIGSFNLTAAATVGPGIKGCGLQDNTFVKDFIVKTIHVKPEGYTIMQMQSSLICPSEENDTSLEWSLNLPNNVVSDSLQVEVSVVADLLGPALENLNGLVELPTGCGEQNMMQLASNIYVVRYIDGMDFNEPSLRSKALNNIHKGYQRQMNFKHSYSGGFSAFGNKDPTPSIWLTAFVIKTLEGARDLTFIDENVINDSLQWIIKSQLENGCFPKIGQVFHDSMQGDSLEDGMTVALTSMVMLGLHASRFPISPSVLENAKFCLTAGIISNDAYSLSLSALALAKLNYTDKAKFALQRLVELSENDDYFLFWQKPGQSLALSVETVSYGILSLLAVGGDDNLILARKAVKWLSKNRNSKGGFVSTLDTVVALEALSTYALAMQPTKNTDLTILVTGQQVETTFRVRNNNRLVLQRHTLPVAPPQLKVSVQGEGCVVVQNMLRYNVDSVKGSEVFDMDITTNSVSTVDTCSLQRLRICIRYKLTNQTSNMAILTVMFVTGYKPRKDSLNDVKNEDSVETFGGVKMWDEEGDHIVFYLNKVTTQVNCIDLVMEQQLAVQDPRPAAITLTDYYHPERTITKMYNLSCIESSFGESMSSNFQDQLMNDDPLSNFHNVDHELATPEGVEGPAPAYASPPQNTSSAKY